ncbi:hypothetical protein TREMEDRAFT_61213 [Tremella mesenterica DSM 1558]|uniref:uncharacterized protein n=1 Tax=Tremella mesenterica (strain ATCC 24925 / CBS 8224 / DSM 1558 / NBRC 9311 / NRRL Y-6157 / RJB 2259-6 / UBC 559-6) TaxID=578456 RepID=UPI0003F48C13|nr:uncharacterized protein TREMEDRAFT_61213 [Tremella mesenterica DSM 1558]EIW70702.1 hypothetical protein TREMEDRAFT_61213 [Tremella mesenterica DSM 1558]
MSVGYGIPERSRYLCLDTNILIHHLPIIREFYDTLIPSNGQEGNTKLLIPDIVIHVMDHPIRLVHFDVQISIGDLAKAATQWLLRSIRSTNSTLSSGTTDHGLQDGGDTYTNIDKNSNGRRNTKDRQRERNERIYCQKRDETINSNLTKGDDKILDCCLFFQRKGEVILWTEDKNLTLLVFVLVYSFFLRE